MHVFVTVGTTQFDQLVECVDSLAFQRCLVLLGYTSLTIQYGRGSYLPESLDAPRIPGLIVDGFDLKQGGVGDEMAKADLVIGHAGAGSILEALSERKRTIVVVNDALLHNHQLELAQALAEQGYLVCCARVADLIDELRRVDWSSMHPFPETKAASVWRDIDQMFGF